MIGAQISLDVEARCTIYIGRNKARDFLLPCKTEGALWPISVRWIWFEQTSPGYKSQLRLRTASAAWITWMGLAGARAGRHILRPSSAGSLVKRWNSERGLGGEISEHLGTNYQNSSWTRSVREGCGSKSGFKKGQARPLHRCPRTLAAPLKP